MKFKVYATNRGYVSVHVYTPKRQANYLCKAYGFRCRLHHGSVWDVYMTHRITMRTALPQVLNRFAHDPNTRARLILALEYSQGITAADRRMDIAIALRRKYDDNSSE